MSPVRPIGFDGVSVEIEAILIERRGGLTG